jgi:hypothetical protein
VALVVRLSPGSEPVVEVHTADLEELDVFLRSMRAQGVWSALKGAAREFADAPLAGIEAVEAAFPGAQVITDGATPATEPAPQLGPEAAQAFVNDWNAKATERAVKQGVIPDPAVPDDGADIVVAPKQSGPRCAKCGAATTFGGTSKDGRREAYFCSTGDRSHTTVIDK